MAVSGDEKASKTLDELLNPPRRQARARDGMPSWWKGDDAEAAATARMHADLIRAAEGG